MYFKGALFLNTLRTVVDDDARWWALVRDVYQHFKYRNIMTEDLVAFFNQRLRRDLTPVFDQYLRRTELPVAGARVPPPRHRPYRWKADDRGFDMPVRDWRRRRAGRSSQPRRTGRRSLPR